MPKGGDSPYSRTQPLIPPPIAAHVAFQFRLFPEIRSDDASFGCGFDAERPELFGQGQPFFFGGAVKDHFGESLHVAGSEFTDERPFAALQVWLEHRIRHYSAYLSSM